MAKSTLLTNDRTVLLQLAQEAAAPSQGITTRTLYSDGGTRLILFSFDEGQELTEHTSTKQAFVQVICGSCDFRVGEETFVLTPGQLLSMPPNAAHAVLARERLVMLLTLADPAPRA